MRRKSMKKRIIGIGMCILLAAGLTACGTPKNESGNEAEKNENGTQKETSGSDEEMVLEFPSRQRSRGFRNFGRKQSLSLRSVMRMSRSICIRFLLTAM